MAILRTSYCGSLPANTTTQMDVKAWAAASPELTTGQITITPFGDGLLLRDPAVLPVDEFITEVNWEISALECHDDGR